jgi:hypothetical protein
MSNEMLVKFSDERETRRYIVPCDFRSSVSEARCILPLGHGPDSHFRFHRYPVQP